MKRGKTTSMRFHSAAIGLATALLCVLAAGAGVRGQGSSNRETAAGDWPLHNRDVRNTRYSPLDQINTSNVSRLAVELVVPAAGGLNIASTTPLVVDGVMYFNSGSQLFALDAATGKEIWTFQADQPFRGGGRGPAYGDGRIYAFGNSDLYAVDAKTGKPGAVVRQGRGAADRQRCAPVEVPGQVPGRFRSDDARLLDDDAAVVLQRHAVPAACRFRTACCQAAWSSPWTA